MVKNKQNFLDRLRSNLLDHENFLSFSGGVESTTLAFLLGGKAIFSDTGSEHKLMYERLDFVESKIREIHKNFEIIRIKPKVFLRV